MSDHPVDLAMIQAAAKRIEGKVRETPMLDPAPNDGGIRGRTGNRPLLGVRPLIIGLAAPNDRGGRVRNYFRHFPNRRHRKTTLRLRK